MIQEQQLKINKEYAERHHANNLWIEANRIIDKEIDENELRKEDVSTLFWYELEQSVKMKELININLNGNVRTGKSTAAMEIATRIKEWIYTYHNVQRPMSNKNVLRDQNEYAKIVKERPESFKHECDVIDEWNEMETTGYNSTILDKYLKDFSDRQAARYYHRVACSPKEVTDNNSDILLQTVPGGRDTGKTPCLLYYRLTRGETTIPVLLGHVVIDVTATLKAAWYKEYLRKKEEKWELMNKHNVKSVRDLEYADVILSTFTRLKGFAQVRKLQKSHIKIFFQDEADKRGIWFSILGDRDILETIEGMLEIYHEYVQLQKNKKISKKIKETYELRLGEMLDRQKKLTKLWNQYQKIEEAI